MPWTVYMIRCGDGSLYTGVTNDLARRLKSHRNGSGAKFTRGRGFLTVAWRKKVADKSAALREEARIKKLPKKQKEAMVLSCNPLLKAYLTQCPDFRQMLSNPGVMPKVVELRDQLVSRYSWAVPTEEALRQIAELSPIVEMGAGTGYWATLLKKMGTDIVPYDRAPPGSLKSLVAACNPWHAGAKQHTRVLQGTPEILKGYADRTLLLCWPPRGSMARQCLGEFGGFTADLKLQETIRLKFELVSTVSIPRWPGMNDMMTVWRRS
jgi:putative endonuclease